MHGRTAANEDISGTSNHGDARSFSGLELKFTLAESGFT
jgi:hypothetical protein